MNVIDADSHVMEGERVWDHLPPEFEPRRPRPITVENARRPSDYLRDRRIHLTCEADERLLPQVLDFLGEDRIMVSADMPHAEARESAMEELRSRADLSDRVKAKLLSENPLRFYNL